MHAKQEQGPKFKPQYCQEKKKKLTFTTRDRAGQRSLWSTMSSKKQNILPTMLFGDKMFDQVSAYPMVPA
jgi:hypothetical protein